MDLLTKPGHSTRRTEASASRGRGDGSVWRVLESAPWLQVGEDGLVPDFPVAGALVVPLKLWQLRREDLVARNQPLGVVLQTNEDPAAIASDLDCFALILTPLPDFAQDHDSIALRLPERNGHRRELKTTDVQSEQAVT
jgi:uncharacterized protein (DUF934 family)